MLDKQLSILLILQGREFVPLRLAAQQVGYSPSAVRQAVRRGDVAAERFNGLWLVDLDGLRHYAQRPTRTGQIAQWMQEYPRRAAMPLVHVQRSLQRTGLAASPGTIQRARRVVPRVQPQNLCQQIVHFLTTHPGAADLSIWELRGALSKRGIAASYRTIRRAQAIAHGEHE